MKEIKIAFVFLFSTFFLTVWGQNAKTDLHELRVDIVYLSSDYLEGRETGKKGEHLAAEYIAKRFEKMGLAPKGNKEGWYHEFDFKFNPNPHAAGGEPRKGRNVLGYIDNGAAKTVVIGAHYDHVGHGEFGSRHTGEPAIHNGADDNASGVAGILQIAQYLKQGKATNNNYLFIGFSGEELGLFGSKNYVNDPTIPLEQVNYMLNLDMVGRLNEEKILAVNGAGTSSAWKPALKKIKVGGIKVKTSDSGVGPSDHTSFYLKDIPVLHFFTGQHMDYHKPEDDAHLVNFEGVAAVSEFIIDLIESLNDSGELAFTKTKDNSGRKVATFKVSLGVMPDYVYAGKGMRIDGVLDDRPAKKAGIEGGDVIIKIGDLVVEDIYSYMEGLSKFKKGDKTTIVVKRGKQEIEKLIEF